jgi:hypothetical protein
MILEMFIMNEQQFLKTNQKFMVILYLLKVDFIRATYSFSAVSFDFPFTLFHAYHLAFPLKSNMPGLLVLLSPTVACLYNPYI